MTETKTDAKDGVLLSEDKDGIAECPGCGEAFKTGIKGVKSHAPYCHDFAELADKQADPADMVTMSENDDDSSGDELPRSIKAIPDSPEGWGEAAKALLVPFEIDTAKDSHGRDRDTIRASKLAKQALKNVVDKPERGHYVTAFGECSHPDCKRGRDGYGTDVCNEHSGWEPADDTPEASGESGNDFVKVRENGEEFEVERSEFERYYV